LKNAITLIHSNLGFTFISHPKIQAMATYTLTVNKKTYTVDADAQMPLLWAIRDFIGLKGTKFGCGISQCGACNVLYDGTVIRSCSFPVSAAVGHQITTIEGISDQVDHPVQLAWIEEQVPQCGYCQSGQIIAAVALLKNKPRPTDAEIDAAMQGNICRCGTYQRIRKAIHRAADMKAAK
jgi:isoquinoline 1-oxidoreductase subunit alpha